MPSLSHERLYGREAMLRALMSAGQFAHLSRDRFLDDMELASSYGGATVYSLYRHLPPIGGPSEFSTALLHWIAHRDGVYCALCGAVDQPVYNSSPELAEFAVPTWLSITGPPQGETYPFCVRCGRTLARLAQPYSAELAKYNFRWRFTGPDPSVAMAAVLCDLLTNAPFRARVERNGQNAARIRFDPRRVPPPKRRRTRRSTAQSGGEGLSASARSPTNPNNPQG